ncbi:hypothetical protein ACHQM5_009406 [Ranunculus cassubicifolius]
MAMNAIKNNQNLIPHDDIIYQILSCIPAKSFSKFRFLNKTWFKILTTDLNFAKLNYNRSTRSNSNPSILAKRLATNEFYLAAEHRSCDNAVKLKVPFDYEGIGSRNSYYVDGICNGLVCLSHCDRKEVFIWNPITKDHISIGYSPVESQSCSCSRTTYFAFGFHQGINEYKVIKVVTASTFMSVSSSDFNLHFSVFTLGKDSSWRTLHENMACDLSLSSSLVNGSLHWLTRKKGSGYEDFIVCFNLETEAFGTMLPPDGVDLNAKHVCPTVGELDGLLCLYCAHFRQEIQIWVKRKYHGDRSWTQLFRIGIPVCGRFHDLGLLGPVSYNGQYILQKNNNELILYNPRSNSIKMLKGFGFQFLCAYRFIGSIISPRLISGAGCNTTDGRGRIIKRKKVYHLPTS